ncbi:type I polyketide synthase [Sorangium sp. So ce1097]|uniref:type I polyketide synthase n=1 Tax=Sorangium sp. So ce1097 TaxID=3133330 RepID=UPI003F5FE7DE
MQLALLSKQLRSKIDGIEILEAEPIAIIGMGCRMPGGARTPAAFWRIFAEGREAITEIPKDRWDLEHYYDPDPDAPGKMSTRWAGLVGQVDGFDPYFFGISPREAVHMDPQQRLLLEVAWEALEEGGVAIDQLAGSRGGVFIGASSGDYAQLHLIEGDPFHMDPYFATGNANCFLAGRLSYLLGLEGPAMVIDTICSSSLVAVHLACQSLRRDECNLALAGGVNIIASPYSTVCISKQRTMAPDGRCKTFDARADGFVRSEGCGVVVLKRLSDALASGDLIHAVIRGSAINQDGRSNGLTAPNVLAQQAVLRQALENGGVSASQVAYVETHGTGTSLGDPIEVEALREVYGRPRPDGSLCALGAAKTNIGHLEAAAGVAGLIKAVLCLEHEQIPRNLHFKQLSPNIQLDGTPFVLPTETMPWARGEKRRLAAVSSFGFSGTNAHVVLEEAPALPAPQAKLVRPLHLLALSAKEPRALDDLAASYAEHLREHPDVPLEDVCATAHKGRSHFAHRLALVAGSTEEMAAKLSAFAEKKGSEAPTAGQVSHEGAPKIAFLFTGQGSQYAGMGRALYETQPAFRDALNRCDALLRPHLATPLLSVLYPEPNAPSPLDETAYTQPALFALEYALTELWRSWGITPSAVIGHSVGEYVAACVAGVFSLQDGLKLVAERGQLMGALPRGGRMAAVFASEERVAEGIAGLGEGISIAAVNGPEEVVISGAADAVQAALAAFAAEGLKVRDLNVSHAFHSACMDPALDALERAVASVELAPPRLALFSNLTGDVAGEELTRASYYRRHAREPVRFAAGIRALAAQGYHLFVEIGPSPTLSSMARRCLPEGTATWLPSLRKGHGDWQQVLGSLGALYARGVAVDWAGFHEGYHPRRVALPTYPFQRIRCWVDPVKAAREGGMVGYYRTVTQRLHKVKDALLRFPPFREVVPGFYALSVFTADADQSPFGPLLREASEEMRRVTFRGIDLSRIRKVLDIGCGAASDVIALGKRYEHLEVHGCNISIDQIELGRQRVRDEGLEGRVKLFYQDSSKDAFPDRYDLAMSFQVIHHIVDKDAVFANVGRHLNNGGFMVMNEILSNLTTDIDHADSTAHFASRSAWAAALARGGLRIVSCVDASREVANFLHDPDYDRHFTEVSRGLDAAEKAHLHGPYQLGWLLRRKLALYLVITAQKDGYLREEELLRINQEKLAARIPYSQLMAAAENGEPPLLLAGAAPVGDTAAEDAGGVKESPRMHLRERLLSAEGEERRRIVEEHLLGLLERVLGVPAARLDVHQHLNEVGLDSLMSLEIKNRIDQEFDLSFPTAELLRGPTILQLATAIDGEVGKGKSAARGAGGGEAWEEGAI